MFDAGILLESLGVDRATYGFFTFDAGNFFFDAGVLGCIQHWECPLETEPGRKQMTSSNWNARTAVSIQGKGKEGTLAAENKKKAKRGVGGLQCPVTKCRVDAGYVVFFFFTGQVCALYAVWLLAAHVRVNALAKHKRHIPRHVTSILLVQVVHSLHRHSVRLLLNLSVGGEVGGRGAKV
jgi:hypothetical protein